MIKLLYLPLLLLFTPLKTTVDPTAEVDTFWDTMSHSVSNGNFERYASLYHEDAVLVSGFSNNSYPILKALAGWKQGFMDTKNGKMKAGVEFRFSKRLHSATTAHDSGMFLYTSQINGSSPDSFLAHFQGLLVKKEGQWKLMMEYQISEGTLDEWKALK